jgi:stearoyl-CoA desaturase (delta-9 desaturase)
VLAGAHLPHLPTREQILDKARTMFARAPGVEDIFDRAYGLLLDAISTHLRAVTVRA